MLFDSLESYLVVLKKLIFDLSIQGFSDEADQINRVVFEGNGIPEVLPELVVVLRAVRREMPHQLRDQVERCESFARNYR